VRWSWLLALAIALSPATGFSQRGHSVKPHSVEPTRVPKTRDSVPTGHFEQGLFGQQRERKEQDRARYKKVLETLVAHESRDELVGAAQDFATARDRTSVKSLGDDMEWLSIRVTGRAHSDSRLVRLSRLIARKQFEVPYSLDRVRVLVTGISETRAARMRNAASSGSHSSPPTEPLVRALLKFESFESTDLTSEIESALRPFKNQLLVLVAHHGSPSRFTTGSNATVLIEMDGRRVDFPVALLARLAQRQRVNLFIYGCESATSQHLGTNSLISADAALKGIERLFDSPITTYGDVFKRLAGPDIQLVFDLLLAENGVYLVADKRDTEVAVPQSGSLVWRISNITPSGNPVNTPSYCTYTDGTVDTKCQIHSLAPRKPSFAVPLPTGDLQARKGRAISHRSPPLRSRPPGAGSIVDHVQQAIFDGLVWIVVPLLVAGLPFTLIPLQARRVLRSQLREKLKALRTSIRPPR